MNNFKNRGVSRLISDQEISERNYFPGPKTINEKSPMQIRHRAFQIL